MTLATLLLPLLLLATPATSQTVSGSNTQTGGSAPRVVNGQAVINNTQNNVGNIDADVPLNVVENDGLTSGVSQATGNSLQGGNQQVDANLTSRQSNTGAVTSTVEANGVNTGAEDLSLGTPLYTTTQAIANYSGFTTTQANATADTAQTASGGTVTATTNVSAPNNAIYISGEGDATTEVNHTAYMVDNGRIVATSSQTSSSDSRAVTSAIVHYSPSDNLYTANATNNYYGASSQNAGSQEHTVTQTASGQTVAHSELFGGNMWNSATQATAVANNTNLENAGGSLVVSNNQTQSNGVFAQAITSTDQFGTASAIAYGTGNNLTAGNNDIYVRVDNTQLSTGGVDVEATFTGNNGYDANVTADAVGNQALAYACSECKGDMGVSNNQTNASNVNATATATLNGQGRSIVSTARATGNSATYYVSGGSTAN